MYVNVEFYDTSFRLVKPNQKPNHRHVYMKSLDRHTSIDQTKSVPLRTCLACLPRSLTKPFPDRPLRPINTFIFNAISQNICRFERQFFSTNLHSVQDSNAQHTRRNHQNV